MKNLFILRHAKSSWDDENLDDFDRPLNSRGQKNAPFMAKIFKNHLNDTKTNVDYILSSSSERTKLTIKEITKEINFRYDDIDFTKKLYNIDEIELKEIVQYISDEYENIVICGHNTAITSFVNSVSNAKIENVPTSAIVGISFKCDSWHDIDKNSGKLFFYEYPKKYKK